MLPASLRKLPSAVFPLLLVLAILAAYGPAIRGGFIWDDDQHVTGNDTLKSLSGLGKIWFEPRATPQYYPLVHTSYWTEYRLWGLHPTGYHLVNVLIHSLNAILVWLILRRLDVPGAGLAAAIFALHPVHVESVAWITERKNVLSGFFYLSALFVYLPLIQRGTDHQRVGGKPWGLLSKRYAAAFVLFLLALLSKTVTCSLPAAILIIAWWKNKEMPWREIPRMAPLLMTGLAFAGMTVWLERNFVGAVGSEFSFSIVDRFLIAGRAVWFYAYKLLWPHPVMFIYPRWAIDSGAAWQYLYPISALGLVAALCFWRLRVGAGALAAALLFGGTLFPALGFFNIYPMRYSFVADHFQYLASLGLIAAFSSFVVERLHRFGRPFSLLLPAAYLLILGTLTWHQGFAYASPEALWRDTFNKNPDAFMARNHLGLIHKDRGETKEALDHFQAALTLKPDAWEIHNNVGLSLAAEGRFDEAARSYQEAIRLWPRNAIALSNLAIALIQLGQLDGAASALSRALELNPTDEVSHSNLGVVQKRLGKRDEAAHHFREALRIRPDYPMARRNYALLLVGQDHLDPDEQGHLDLAIEEYFRMISEQPSNAGTRADLGAVLARRGRLDEAIVQFTEALRLDPSRDDVRRNLETILRQRS